MTLTQVTVLDLVQLLPETAKVTQTPTVVTVQVLLVLPAATQVASVWPSLTAAATTLTVAKVQLVEPAELVAQAQHPEVRMVVTQADWASATVKVSAKPWRQPVTVVLAVPVAMQAHTAVQLVTRLATADTLWSGAATAA